MPELTLTDQNFKSQVITSKTPVIVDFWAPWCQPCKIIDPILEELAKEYEGRVILGKINADENPQVVNQLTVMGMPTVIFFKGGKPVKALVGAQAKNIFKQAIEEVLKL